MSERKVENSRFVITLTKVVRKKAACCQAGLITKQACEAKRGESGYAWLNYAIE